MDRAVPNAFNFDTSPFDCLTAAERRLVRDHVDIAYYREGAVILDAGQAPGHLFVIFKGHVRQFEADEPVDTLATGACFDGRALVAGRSAARFVAAEEVLAYQIARQVVLDLIAGNATFGALLFADLSKKLAAVAERDSRHELQSLSLARVSDTVLRPATIVDGKTDIVSVVKVFQAERCGSVLVRDAACEPPRLGVFTTTGLQRAILHGAPLAELPVRELASFGLVSVRPGDLLFDALALMIRHQVHRLVVMDGDRVEGFLEQLDLLSFLSNHSYLITRQIVDAGSLDELAAASAQITQLISRLFKAGTRVALVARLVQELNAKLFERAWQLIAPAELVANSCLVVMGSEGRGEQLLRTDQDNALVLRDGYRPPADLDVICWRFSAALARFGYPECPGRIMVSNAAWRHDASAFGQTLLRWLQAGEPEGLMSLAIFLDAQAVAGDASLLAQVRARLDAAATDHDATLARFAAAIDAFDTQQGWWNRLVTIVDPAAELLDLKKAGLFPLVHGVRALALQQHVPVTGTAERIQALAAAHVLPADLAPDLVEALHFLMALRLRIGLDALELGRPDGRAVDPRQLPHLERDLLKDSLAVVKRFRAWLRQRFRLDML